METPTQEKSNPSLETSKIEKPMCNIKKQDIKNLSLTPVLLGRHPSAIHLEQGNKPHQEIVDDCGASQQFCGVSISLPLLTMQIYKMIVIKIHLNSF